MRFAPLLAVSLLLHLAVIVAFRGSYPREFAGRHTSLELTVAYIEPGQDRESHPQKQSPGPTAAAESHRKPRHKSRPVMPSGTMRSPGLTAGTVPSPTPGKGVPAQAASESVAPVPGIVPISSAKTGSTEMSLGMTPDRGATGTGSGGGSGVGSGTDAGHHEGGGPGETRGTGPSGTTGGSLQRRAAYQDLLKRLIEAHKDYPFAARRSRQEGGCRRRFALSRDGSIKRVEALSSCGHALLDEAATRAITAVGTFPPLPDEYKGAEATFTIIITFSLKELDDMQLQRRKK